MWIRSQDLYTLIKCERLSIKQYASENYCVIGDECIVLGEYSKVDKALKVLDEIQEQTGYMYGNVYEMPMDEDVEV